MTTIKVDYLSDHGIWETYGYLEGNYSASDTRVNKVLIFSKAVRIYPVEIHNKISLKADIATIPVKSDDKKLYQHVFVQIAQPNQYGQKEYVKQDNFNYRINSCNHTKKLKENTLIDAAYFERNPERNPKNKQFGEIIDALEFNDYDEDFDLH